MSGTPARTSAGRRGKSGRTITRRTVSAQVSDILRDMILTGEFAPGEALTHERVSTLLDVSAMPVREALLRLAHEGLIETQENRSFRVATMTHADIQDLFWLHETISAELAARASQRATAPVLEALGSMTTASEEGGPGDCYHLHNAINAAAESPRMTSALTRVTQLIPEHYYRKSDEWRSATLESHRAIVEAIEQRDADAARKLMAGHVREAAEYLIRYFTTHGFWKKPSD